MCEFDIVRKVSYNNQMHREYPPLSWQHIQKPSLFVHKGTCLGSSVANGVNLLKDRITLTGDMVDRAARIGPFPIRNERGIRIALNKLEQQIGSGITINRSADSLEELRLASKDHPVLLPVNFKEWHRVLAGRSVRVGNFEKVKRVLRTDHLILVYDHKSRGDLNSVFDINAEDGYSAPRQMLEDIASEVFFLSRQR